MAFQRESLQNRHTWEVDDLRRAGLNPILSANNGGPGASGASYVPQNVAKDAPDNVQTAINSKSQRSLMAEQMAATNASAKASLATAQNQMAQAGLNRVNATNNSMLTPGLTFQAAIDNLKVKPFVPWMNKWSDTTAGISTTALGGLEDAIRNPRSAVSNSAKPSPPPVVHRKYGYGRGSK